jgi:hypothetical protein
MTTWKAVNLAEQQGAARDQRHPQLDPVTNQAYNWRKQQKTGA